MNQRWLMLGIASGVAGAILALTLFFGGSNAPATKPALSVMQPGQTPPPLKSTSDAVASSTSDAISPTPGAGSAQGYVLRSTTGQGIPVEITGQTLDPLPQGQWKVGRPMTRIQLSDHQLVQIQAEGGTVLAPANQPRSGDLRGHVTLFLFEGQPGRALNTSYGSPDLVLRLRLEEARFDLELGQIDSEGPVELDHVRFAFRGRGLSLTFNQLHQRIDHLEIFQGRSLRLKTQTTAIASHHEQLSSPIQTEPPALTDRPPVYYQAQVFETVQVTSPQADLTGDVLRVLFAMGQEQASVVPGSPRADRRSPSAQPSTVDDAGNRDREAVIFKPDPQDVVVQWTGRLVVEPLAEKPAGLTGPEDMQLALVGAPATIVTRQQDRIRTSLVEYRVAEDRVRLKGTTQTPVEIDSAELGKLSLPELVLEPRQGRGVIPGGGELHGADRSVQVQSMVTGTSIEKLSLATSALPAGMSIVWSERLHLLFDTPHWESDGKTSSTIGRLGPLRQAVFQGKVQVREPRLQLDADELAVRLTSPPPMAQGQPVLKPTLDHLEAVGNVRVQTVGANESISSATTPSVNADEALTLTCERFQVVMDLKMPSQAEPDELRAFGRVDAQMKDRRIQADSMVVQLLPGLDLTADPSAQASTSRMPVRRIRAEKNVLITEKPLQASIVAHQVTMDAVREHLTALGHEQTPAELRLPDATLTSPRIDLDQSHRKLTAPEGVFVFSERDSRDPAAPPAVITTVWTRDMSFDHAAGQVLFRGNVRTDSLAHRDTMKLTCEELAILFDTASNNPSPATGRRDLRQVKTLAARRDVVFQSENWLDKPQGKLATRLTLQGPDLLFENARQAVQILGPGRMLFEDYRPAPADASPVTRPANEPRLRFAGGRGATLFTWQGQLTFDTAGNDMTIVETVRMTHRPAESPSLLTLDCSRFIADLEPTGGISSWASGTAPNLALRSVTALGPVKVVVGGPKPVQVQTSQLVYDGKTESLLLQADPGMMTTVQEAGQPGLTAEAIRWDMPQERWEIIRPGASRVPLGR